MFRPTKSDAKNIVKERGKATAIQATISEESIKVATNQAANNSLQQVFKEVLLEQNAKSTSAQLAKAAVANTAKSTVIAGLIIEGAIYSVSVGQAVYKYSKGKMNHEQFIDFTVEQTATTGGSAAGGIGGSLAGIATGAAIGSIVPGIGTVIGGTIGGFLGCVGGGVGGSLLGKGIGKAINYTRKGD